MSQGVMCEVSRGERARGEQQAAWRRYVLAVVDVLRACDLCMRPRAHRRYPTDDLASSMSFTQD